MLTRPRYSTFNLERKEDAALENCPAAHAAVPNIPNVNLYDWYSLSFHSQDH